MTLRNWHYQTFQDKFYYSPSPSRDGQGNDDDVNNNGISHLPSPSKDGERYDDDDNDNQGEYHSGEGSYGDPRKLLPSRLLKGLGWCGGTL